MKQSKQNVMYSILYVCTYELEGEYFLLNYQLNVRFDPRSTKLVPSEVLAELRGRS